jgi:hypothetical protein
MDHRSLISLRFLTLDPRHIAIPAMRESDRSRRPQDAEVLLTLLRRQRDILRSVHVADGVHLEKVPRHVQQILIGRSAWARS